MRLGFQLVAVIAAAMTTGKPYAQRVDDYPSRAVRVIVPFSPGGPPDVIGRPLLQKLSEAFNQPFVFDNRPGASGSLGTDIVAKSPRDGYTLLYTTGSHNTNSLLIRKLPLLIHRPLLKLKPLLIHRMRLVRKILLIQMLLLICRILLLFTVKHLVTALLIFIFY